MRWTKYQLVLVRQEVDIGGAWNLDHYVDTHHRNAKSKKEKLCTACTWNDQDQGEIRTWAPRASKPRGPSRAFSWFHRLCAESLEPRGHLQQMACSAERLLKESRGQLEHDVPFQE